QRQAVARVQRLERGGVAAGPGLHQGFVAVWLSRLVHAQHPTLAVARCKPQRGRRAGHWQGGGQAHARYNARAGEKGSSGSGAGAMLAAAVKVSTEPMTPIRRLDAVASAAGMRAPVAQDRLHAALRELLPEADWIAAGWRCPDAPGMAEGGDGDASGLLQRALDDEAGLPSDVLVETWDEGDARLVVLARCHAPPPAQRLDRKSTRLNSSHVKSSYAVFCLKKRCAGGGTS